MTLNEFGLGNKQSFDEHALHSAHAFSSLQRFRQGMDLQSAARPAPKASADTDEDDDDQENDCRVINLPSQISGGTGPLAATQPEQKFWLEENSAAARRSMQAKQEAATKKTEKERYLKALRALVDEKGGREGKIPDLCSCGALRYTASSAADMDAPP